MDKGQIQIHAGGGSTNGKTRPWVAGWTSRCFSEPSLDCMSLMKHPTLMKSFLSFSLIYGPSPNCKLHDPFPKGVTFRRFLIAPWPRNIQTACVQVRLKDLESMSTMSTMSMVISAVRWQRGCHVLLILFLLDALRCLSTSLVGISLPLRGANVRHHCHWADEIVVFSIESQESREVRHMMTYGQ